MEKRVLELLEQLASDVRELKGGQGKLEQGQSKLEQGQSKIERSMAKLEQSHEELKSQVAENTSILKALEHAAQVNKAEHDVMMNDIAQMKGDIVGIRKDLSLVEMVSANNWSDISRLKAAK